LTEYGEIIINNKPIKWFKEAGKSRKIDPHWEATLEFPNKAGIMSKGSFYYKQPMPIDVPLYEGKGRNQKTSRLLRGLDEFGYKGLSQLNPDERFIAIVTALSELKSGTSKFGYDAMAIENPRAVWEYLQAGKKRYPEGISSKVNILKFLAIGRYAGLYSKDQEGKPPPPEKAEPTKLDKEIGDFEIHPAIVKWKKAKLDKFGKTKVTHSWVIQLHTMLKVLDLSIEDFLAGMEFRDDGTPTGAKIGTLGDTWKFQEYMKQLASQKRFVDYTGREWSLNEWLKTTKPPTISGGNIQSEEGDKIREISVPEGTPEGIATSRLREGKMRLKNFLSAHGKVDSGKHDEGSWFHVGQPSLLYAHLEMTARQIMHMEECLSQALPEVFDNRPRIYKLGAELDEEGKVPSKINENYMKLITNPDFDPNMFDERGIYEITEETGRFHPPADEWLALEKIKKPKFMQKGRGEDKLYDKQVARYERAKKQAGTPIVRKYETTKLDWYDAYCYFIYAVDIGWRDNEAFTMSASTSGKDFASSEKKKTAIRIMGQNKDGTPMIFDVKFLTRKTWGISDRQDDTDRYFHVAQVMDARVKHYMQKRINQVQEGMDSDILDQQELLKKYRILTKYNQEYWNKKKERWDKREVPNTVHALIGADDEYIKVGTMDKQSFDDLDAEQQKSGKFKRDMMVKQKRQEIIRAIMRSCYQQAIPDLYDSEPYWKKMSLHSLRHVFAQAWIKRSGGDFNFVAERGHWGGIGILEKAYGGTTEKQQMLSTITYSKQSLEWAEARELAQLPPDVRESFEALQRDIKKKDIATKEQEKRIKKAGGTVAQIVTAESNTAGVEEKKKSSGVDDDQIQ
jgi:hypothetical protein